MEMLPPVGWADVATKRDLDHLSEVLRAQLATNAAELRTEVTAALSDVTRRLTFRFLTIAVAIFAAGVAARLG